MNPVVIVLAAGQGKRMRSDLPKVLQPLAGQPLLGHVLETARALHPAAIHVVHGHGGDLVQSSFPEADLQWVLQREQLGTGHAVAQALPSVDDSAIVIVLYGDVPLLQPSTLEPLLAAAAKGSLAVLTVTLGEPSGYGRIQRNPSGGVSAIVEQRDATPEQLAIRECNTGVLAAPAAALRRWLGSVGNNNAQGEYYLTDVVAQAVAEGVAVAAIATPLESEVLGVNDRIQLAAVESMYRARRAHELMLAGVTLVDPARIDVRGTLTVGRDSVIDVNAVFEGTVKLGDRVRIGPNCVIRDATIGNDTQLHANCVVDRAEIAERCRIGPFARLRPGAALDVDVHIGNFVEVKNTTLAAGSKANHLTYLGDAQIGPEVNVGAGTVTCNYDGANKWRTQIDAGAFIGSGTMLVAPVRVGAGATIGAGSTITKDVAAGDLALTRARQTALPGWKRPTRTPGPD